MKTPHKHAELIKAWAEGAEIEKFDGKTWQEVKIPIWCLNDEYRIKPEPKPDVVLFSSVDEYKVPSNNSFFLNIHLVASYRKWGCDNLKLTFDGETLKLKSAEVI